MSRPAHQSQSARSSLLQAGMPLLADNEPAQRPALCRMVIVTTTGAIRGRTEHAAMITAVISDAVVDVLMSPAGEMSYPVQGVPYAESASNAPGISWRWPPRV